MTFRISDAARRAAYEKQQAEMRERSVHLRARLAAKAEEHGPDSLWAEMLADFDARQAAK